MSVAGMPMSRKEVLATSMSALGKLPPTMQQLLSLINDPKVSPKDIAKIVSYDPSLAYQVLKAVNCAFYGIPREITNITQAVVLLGLTNVRNLCLGLSMSMKLAQRIPESKSFKLVDFWRHSLATAIASKIIANQVGESREVANNAFLGGLLHDIGKLVLYRVFTNEYAELVEESLAGDRDLLELELQFCEQSHADVGGNFVVSWGMDSSFVSCIVNHHQIPSSPQYESLCKIVKLGNKLANLYGFNCFANSVSSNIRDAEELRARVFEKADELKIDTNLIETDIRTKVISEVKQAESFVEAMILAAKKSK
ncbi:MAG: HDOD domain-containing protein [Planctomycetes bacterium]|nr:HDOD domain-containing protein [Planctomycetota bacterium]